MSTEEFIEECGKENVHGIFRQYPNLWQALARVLFKRHANDKMILSALKGSLRELFPFKADDLQLDLIFQSVVKKGHSINQIIKKEMFVDKYQKDAKIKIIHGDKTWDISKNRLMEISEFFKVATTDSWRKKKKTAQTESDSSIPLLVENNDVQDHDEINLSSHDIAWVNILIDAALNNPVKMTKNTIVMILDAADYFGMPDLITRCDNFIIENNLSDEIFQIYELQKSIDAKLTFCKTLGLLKTHKALINETKNRLYSIAVDDLSVLQDIALLDLEQQKEIGKSYYAKEFISFAIQNF